MTLLVLLLATAAPLERDPAYQAAEAAYNEFEFESARLAFEKLAARRRMPDADRARLQLWIGMCHAEEGALDEAARDFEAAAVIDPDVEALPFMSPKARRMLQEARERAQKSRPPERPRPRPDPEPVPEPSAPEPPLPQPSPLLVGGGAVLAVGGLAAVGATVAGVAAQAAAAEAIALDDAAAATARHVTAQQLAIGANIGFAAAAVAVAAGAGLLLAGTLGAD